MVDDLEAKGLAVRRPVRGDRRLRAVTLTDKGKRLHNRADAAARKHEIQAFSALSDRERAQLRAVMLKLVPLPTMFVPPAPSDVD